MAAISLIREPQSEVPVERVVVVTATRTRVPTNEPGPTPTAKLVEPTRTPIIVPSPTPEPLGYNIVSLSPYANAEIDEFSLKDFNRIKNFEVPFEVGLRCATESRFYAGLPTVIDIPVTIEQPKEIYFLIGVGWGYKEFEDEVIGDIELSFDSDDKILVELRLGDNIRDIARVAEKVSNLTDHYARQVWEEGVWNVDMLTIPIPEDLQEQTLTSIVIEDISEQTVENLDPSIYLYGITVASKLPAGETE
jgi:hypothetical protein